LSAREEQRGKKDERVSQPRENGKKGKRRTGEVGRVELGSGDVSSGDGAVSRDSRDGGGDGGDEGEGAKHLDLEERGRSVEVAVVASD
jgi:hypothetical protein